MIYFVHHVLAPLDSDLCQNRLSASIDLRDEVPRQRPHISQNSLILLIAEVSPESILKNSKTKFGLKHISPVKAVETVRPDNSLLL